MCGEYQIVLFPVDGAASLPKYDRDKEEMEILKRYIRREDAHIEVRECSCAQTNIDFNRQFQFDNKVSTHKLLAELPVIIDHF